MRNVSYIIKRIIIGVGIALVLAFLKSTPVFALNGNFDSVLMCSNNLGCNTSTTLPYSYAYSDSARINFSSINLVRGKTYNISFYMNITSPGFTFGTGYPQLFVIDSNNNATRAYPDRGESLLVNNTGGNTYSVNWTFELDNTGGNYVGAYVIFTFSANYNANIYSTYINSSNFLYFDSADPSGNQDIINNQNNNTQNIINNNNTNTQDIINNQNENTDKEIESQKVCNNIDIKMNYNDRNSYTSGFLLSNGTINQSSTTFLSSFQPISSNQSYIISTNKYTLGNTSSYCIYDFNKTLISCEAYNNRTTVSFTPSSDGFVRYSAYLFESGAIVSFTGKICKNGNQAISDEMQDINNTINDDNVDTNQANGFFSNFSADNHGLSGIISAPLRLINSLSSSTCSPLVLPLPFVQQNATLPCMSTIYNQFPTFYSLWQLITTGLIGYWVIIKIYGKIHEFQDPNVDRVEVLEL